MFSSPEPNKATPDSNSNSQDIDKTEITEQSTPEQVLSQQELDLELKTLKTIEQNIGNLVKDEKQPTKAEQQALQYGGAKLSTAQSNSHWWSELSLRTKAIALAIALGTLPVLAIGTTGYYFADQSIIKQIKQEKKERAFAIADQLNNFMFERYGDIQIIANLPLFKNPKVRAITSLQDRQEALNRFLDAYGVYDSIAIFALNGDVVAQSRGKQLGNHRDREYFQQVLKTNAPVVSQPEESKTSGELVIHLAAPIKDGVTGETIGIARSRMPVTHIKTLIERLGSKSEEFHVIASSGKYFIVADKEKDRVGKDAKADFPDLPKLQAKGQATVQILVDRTHGKDLASYAPLGKKEGLPDLNWEILLTSETATAFAPQRQLLLTMALGTGLTALLVGALAVILANRAIRPLLAATNAVEKLGQGELDTRIEVVGQDEIATLGSNINLMAAQLHNWRQALLQNQKSQLEQARFLADIASLGVLDFKDLDSVFDRAAMGSRKILKTERVVIYRFNPDWSGYITAESVLPGWPRALGDKIHDSCISQELIDAYTKGRVVPTNNVFEAGFHPEHLELMKRLQIKANLVTPILKDGQLFGLLIAHHCTQPHEWEASEINFLRQVSSQLGFILDRMSFLEEQKAAKEQLQRRALELLIEVDPVSKGDLTIRASVTEDEIGTIADSYNSTIASLRKIVTQVQTAATQVATTTSSNEASVSGLSQEALRQTEEISAALERIQEMSVSIRNVATSAQEAEVAVQQATQTVAAGDAAMNRTVDGILAIRDTVTSTTEKVKRLEESSQKISKVVKLINAFADQTNLLALNAAIEAARAGEEGRGFAVVADEVGLLARQSQEATAEIESLVAAIQEETQAVAAAMEAGTEQVAEGTRLVDETRQNLNRITFVSAQIGELIGGIASSAIVQSQTSTEVTQTMSDVAAIALKTSTAVTQVSDSFRKLLTLASDLQTSTSEFKVG